MINKLLFYLINVIYTILFAGVLYEFIFYGNIRFDKDLLDYFFVAIFITLLFKLLFGQNCYNVEKEQ